MINIKFEMVSFRQFFPYYFMGRVGSGKKNAPFGVISG
jgi:hypothetical protein